MIDPKKIEEIISTIPYITQIYFVKKRDSIIQGKVQIGYSELDHKLDFSFTIYPQYPLKHHASESITFYNEDLIALNHVMENGSICIHNSHNTKLQQKLLIDFDSLKQWIEKYYINREKDLNYEHIIVSENLVDDNYYSYIFTSLDHEFKKGNYGNVKISPLQKSIYKDKIIQNYLVNSFKLNKLEIDCNWSQYYKDLPTPNNGLFYFLKDHPATHNKFIFKNWEDFKGLFSLEFLDALHNYEQSNKKHSGTIIPLFIGYNTIINEIHWQVALLKIGQFPIKGVKNVLTKQWYSELINQNIDWALTKDSSYKYFFGRGKLAQSITGKQILILGVGAIGSILAKTLTRSGCKKIDLADYDVKEPENICRSEYMFQFGLSDKVIELQDILQATSPFVEVDIIKKEYFESLIKTFRNDSEVKEYIIENINEYDLVFDCTTDDDLMHILNSLDLTPNIINLSITNHAQELVCAFKPNIYNFVSFQYNEILENDLNDLHEPTGCWSPTFKASYNDIDMLVQFALNHINKLFVEHKPKKNFVISKDYYNLKIKEY